MSEDLEAFMRAIEGMHHYRGDKAWNEAPMLYGRKVDGRVGIHVLVDLGGDFDLADLVRQLGKGARSQQSVTGEPFPSLDSYEALVLIAEAWTFPREVGERVYEEAMKQPEHYRAAWASEQMQKMGKPSEHPERVECRTVTAVTKAGETKTGMRLRGEGELKIHDSSQGRLPDALFWAMHGEA